MKKLSTLFLSLVAMATTVTSCTKEDDSTPTALELTIKDETGAAVSGASVMLLDKATATTPVATLISDNSGKVKFDNLNTIVYYFIAKSGCKANLLTDYKTAAPLVANKTDKMDIAIKGIATLTVTNASQTASYNIYLNDKLFGKIGPNQQGPITLPSGEEFIVKAVKLNGTVETTDVITDTFNFECGDTMGFSIPAE